MIYEHQLNNWLCYLHDEEFPEVPDEERSDHFDDWIATFGFKEIRQMARDYADSHGYARGEADQVAIDYYQSSFGI